MSISRTIGRALKWIIGIIIVLVVIVVAASAWLLATESGRSFALKTASSLTDGALHVQSSSGTLLGPLVVDGLSYHDKATGTSADIRKVTFDLDVHALLSRTVHVTDFGIDGATVNIMPSNEPEEKSSGSTSLKLPVNVVLDNIHASNVVIRQAGKTVFIADSLKLAASATSKGIKLKELALRSPAGKVDLAGHAALSQGYPGKADGSFQWNVGANTWAGTLKALSDDGTTTATIALTQPMTANVAFNLQQAGNYPWTLDVTIPKTTATSFIGSGALKSLAVDLHGKGDKANAVLEGTVTANGNRLVLKPLDVHFDADNKKLVIKQLALTASNGIEGTLKAGGTVDLAAKPARADIHLAWQDVLVPADLLGQPLASNGKLTFAGNAKAFKVNGKIDAGLPQKPAHIALDVSGSSEAVDVHRLDIIQKGGHLKVAGKVVMTPAIGWNLTVNSKHFNPGELAAGLDGTLDLNLATHGKLTDKGPAATLDLQHLSGKLLDHVFSGNGKLAVTPDYIVDGHLALASGKSTINIKADGDTANHAVIDLAIASLGDWLPGGKGSLDGTIAIDGVWPKLGAKGHLKGDNLSWQDNHADKVDVSFDIPDILDPNGKLNVDGKAISAPGITIKSLTLDGTGKNDHQQLAIRMSGHPLSLQLDLAGKLAGKAWTGTLTTLNADFDKLPDWKLTQPAKLSWDAGNASLTDLCLASSDPVLCADAKRTADGSLDANYTLDNLTLRFLLAMSGQNATLHATGVLQSQGHFQRKAGGALTGKASITSDDGALGYAAKPKETVLAYHDLKILADLTPQGQHVTLGARLNKDGHLGGDVTVTGPARALAGNVDIRLQDLSAIELFTKAVADVAGNVNGKLRLGGTVASPEIHGTMKLADFGAKLPSMGMPLHDGNFTISADNPQQLAINGKIGVGKGSLQTDGTVAIGGQPVSADMQLAWQGIVLPKKLTGQVMASHGKLAFKGSAQRFTVDGKLAAGQPEHLADITLAVSGTPKLIRIGKLDVVQKSGKLAVTGTVGTAPALDWNLDVTSNSFDPGELVAGMDGSLDLDLGTIGKLTDAGPNVALDLRKLSGNLLARQLSGHGKLRVTPQFVIDGKLQLASGKSTIAIDADGDNANHAVIKLAIRSLADLLPGSRGSVNGTIKVDGKWPALAASGTLDGNGLAVQGNDVKRFSLAFDVPDITHPGGKIKLDAGQITAGSLTIKSLDVDGHGNSDRHELTVAMDGKPLSLRVALAGHLKGKAWNGTLSRLDLDFDKLPDWKLTQPAGLSWNQGKASLSDFCLSAGKPKLCASALQSAAGQLTAQYKLDGVTLPFLLALSGGDAPIKAEGALQSSGKFARTPGGTLTGTASITSASGSVGYVDNPKKKLLTYRNLDIAAKLTPDGQHVTLGAQLDQAGSLKGDVRIKGAQQALSGNINVHLQSLAAIELFTTAVANVKGQLDIQLALAGKVAAPAINGSVNLKEFGAEVPAAGIKLHDGNIAVTTRNPQQFAIDGQIVSGKGTLHLDGVVGIAKGSATHLTIKGNHVQAADIPGADVAISPDLAIDRGSNGLKIAGTVALDKADIRLDKLPGGSGGSGISASPDVVIVDDDKPDGPNASTGSSLPVTANVEVLFGRKTHLTGYGINGNITGELNVSQRPGHATTGKGQIQVDGTFKAYGQDLKIKQGRLLFASTPIDNPGLSIRAVRDLTPRGTIDDGQVVGLQISGTAKNPVMTVFSNPAMEQSDALSYLITGKPLSAVDAGEGNAVNTAAQALGSMAGDKLAKNIGSKLGIEAGVSNSTALGTTAFTVGKYLSPRLYIGYGVGVFDPGQVVTLRYIFTRHWNFEAQQADDYTRAAINFRYER